MYNVLTTYSLACLLLFVAGITNAQNYPCPVNGNAESGSFQNWQTFVGSATNPQKLNIFYQGFDQYRFGVQDTSSTYPPTNLISGIDKFGNFPVPSEGTYCLSVGNRYNGARAEAVKFTFTVTPQNMHFKLRYALVLNDGGHSDGENPAAWFYFMKGNGIAPGLASLPLFHSTIEQFVADSKNPFFKVSSIVANQTPVVYRPWECLEFDLSAFVGQTVSFVAMVRDCVQSGHFGYLYLDGLCTDWPAFAAASLNGTQFCREEEIVLDGSASQGEDSYFVEVAEMNANNMYAYASGGLLINDWFVAQQAPSHFSVSDYITSKGKTLECGKKYKVKLAVANHCAPWNETNMWFDVICPQIDAGPDVAQCCAGEGTAQDYGIGDSPIAGNTYEWSSIPAGFNSTTANVSVAPQQNTAYIVNMTQPDGCVGTDTVIFRFIHDQYNMSLSKEYALCDYTPTVTATISDPNCTTSAEFNNAFGSMDYTNVKWSFQPENGSYGYIGAGSSIDAPNADGTLMATVLNPICNSAKNQTIDLQYRPNEHTLIAPNAFTPDNNTNNDFFRILEAGPFAPQTVGEGPAYGIKDFRLRIWNRWGENCRTVTKLDAGRAWQDNVMQGDIFWDGKNNNGTLAQDGVYVYTLEMQYCGATNFKQVCLDNSVVNPCLVYSWFNGCKIYVSGCASEVNLIR